MTDHPRIAADNPKPGAAEGRGPETGGQVTDTLFALAHALSELHAAIELTEVPTARLRSADPAEVNLFENAQDAALDDEDDALSDPFVANYLRDTSRSALAQSRVVALRRRRIRAHIRRDVPLWTHPAARSDHELRDLRALIYAPDPEAEATTLAAESRPSAPLRLATHALSLSLVATALPVGAALMTYNILRGEDIRLTARMTTLCGLALVVLAGNPHLANLIGA